MDPAKRAVHVADVRRRTVRRRTDAWDLGSLLRLSRGLARDGVVLVGVDLALGAPRSLVEAGAARANDFPAWLAAMASRPTFFETVTRVHDWSPRRPFFRVPSGEGSLTAFRDAAGVPLRRAIDVAAAAKSPFIVSGIPGSVGSATRAFWRELHPHLAAARDFALSPFERTRTVDIRVAETYPGIAYGVALAEELPCRRLLVAKTRVEARRRYCDRLLEAAWIKAHRVDLGDVEAARASEDEFDSWITAVAVLRCLVAGHALLAPEWTDARFEGGMLLSGVVQWNESAHRVLVPGARRRGGRRTARAYPCPIDGCEHVFRGSRGGWDAHVASLRRHPDWAPEVAVPRERKALFRSVFRRWFGD